MKLNCTAKFLPGSAPDKAKPWLGECKQYLDLYYWGISDEAAKSGVRRLAKKKTAFYVSVDSSNRGTNLPAPTKKLRNRVAIVLDRSGSMSNIRAATIKAYNRVLDELKANAASTGQETTLTRVTFANDVRFDSLAAPIESAPQLTWHNYNPGGGTALLKATRDTIEQLRIMPGSDDVDTSMLVIVITDGEENSSGIRPDVLKALMKQMNATDRWTFAFQVPRGYGARLASEWGIEPGNITEWDATEAGTFAAAAQNSVGINSYYASRSVGKSSVKDFYTTDLSQVTLGQVKKALTNVALQVRIINVEREEELRKLVERKTMKPLLKGSAFYQLTKAEKNIQDYKQLLLVEKNQLGEVLKVYAGADARSLLGLPEKGDVKVVPGNHGNWDVFVQSTSTNRKLVRGTKVVYWAAIGVPYKEGQSSTSTFMPARRKR